MMNTRTEPNGSSENYDDECSADGRGAWLGTSIMKVEFDLAVITHEPTKSLRDYEARHAETCVRIVPRQHQWNRWLGDLAERLAHLFVRGESTRSNGADFGFQL